MTRPTAFATRIFTLALMSLLWFSSFAPALAATVTDTFPLTLSGTEQCRDNPKFVETLRVKITEGMTITLQHDSTDIQATMNTHGQSATIDAITLHGRVLPANKSGSIAQLALSGRDPGNPDHFMTLRGQATFDKSGNLIKVTGTFVNQITGTYTIDTKTGAQSPPMDCLNSGTFATGKKPPPPPLGNWTEEAYLKAQTPGVGESFGNSLAVSGDMVAVGKMTGEVSLFSRNSATSELWSRSSVLPLGILKGQSSLALDGNTLAVAGVYEPATNTGLKVVNLYTQNTPGAWVYDRSILPPYSGCWGCNAPGKTEGVILSGSTLVLNDIGILTAGAVAIYRRGSSGFWGLPTVLTAPVPAVGDWFGSASSLSGDILAVGASVPFGSGSVYVFTYNPNTGTWSEPQQLNSPNPPPGGGFGDSIAVSGDLLAVGSPFENVVYLFARDPTGGTWTQTKKLSGGSSVGGFGSSVGLAGDSLVVGSISTLSPLGGYGNVHVFTKNTAGSWIKEARIAASNADSLDWFGEHLIFDGTTILVGARSEAGNGIDPADNSVQLAGAAYVYRRAP